MSELYITLTYGFLALIIAVFATVMMVKSVLHVIKACRYIKSVYPFKIDGNVGRKKGWVELILDACEIAEGK